MKVMWLCNLIPGAVQAAMGRTGAGGLWVDQALAGLRQAGVTVRILCPGPAGEWTLDEKTSCRTFPIGAPHEYQPALEEVFARELAEYAPEVIHVWGTEYPHTLAMVRCAEQAGLLDHLVVSIQGLCHVIAERYLMGLPEQACRSLTFRDLVRKDSLLQQQEKFRLRGENEKAVLALARHVMGRTSWDRSHTAAVNPRRHYHFCNETLREPFYEGRWRYDRCEQYRIFAPGCDYPVKGFHILLEAFAPIAREFPEAMLAVPGPSPLAVGLRRNGYQKYLCRLLKKHRLENRVKFLGPLTAEQMKQQYLRSHVFVLPSVMENSPNSLGEAMVLGVPCAAADVGGVAELMGEGEGLLWPAGDSKALEAAIRGLFRLGGGAAQLGAAARAHGRVTHDPETNRAALLDIYESLR